MRARKTCHQCGAMFTVGVRAWATGTAFEAERCFRCLTGDSRGDHIERRQRALDARYYAREAKERTAHRGKVEG